MKHILLDGGRITVVVKSVRIENEDAEGFDLVLEKVEGGEERFRVRYEDFPFLRKVTNLHAFQVFPSGIWWDEVDEGIEFDSLKYPERFPLYMHR